ncbi:MAG: hypothetical protein ABIB11_01390 [Candidatus Omnitrophota bacterium]
MSASDILINRDTDNDILYVMKKNSDKASPVNVSATADILLRLHPRTKKVVGLTIEGFSKVMPGLKNQTDYHLMERFDAIIGFLNVSHLAKV